ncbi:MAG: hypothetical protein LBR62_01220 [Puniceicoccales bacterium]|nr:hypothetical protein [Puniceicoccales bacterium]
MTFRPVFRLLGLNGLLLTLAFGLCAGVGRWGFSESLRPWIPAIGLALLLGILGFFSSPRGRKKRPFMRKEILLTVGIGWLLNGLLGAVPYGTIGGKSFCDALFESCSGLTSTGASVIGNLAEMPKGLLLWRSLSQWLGGLGFVAFFVPFFGTHTPLSKFLYANESTAILTEDCAPVDLRRHMWKSLSVYILLTLLGGSLFYGIGMNLLEAVCYGMTTLGTGGFCLPRGETPGLSSPLVEWAMIPMMFLGGVNFLLLFRALTFRTSEMLFNTEFIVYFILAVGSGIGLALPLMHQGYPLLESLRGGLFQATSLLTTTGYPGIDPQVWPEGFTPLFMTLMFVGGCSGSTAGGIKVFRIILLFKIVFLHLEKIFRRSVVRPLQLGGQRWTEEDQYNLLCYFLLIVLSSLVVLCGLGIIFPEMGFKSLFSLHMACFFNTGLGNFSGGFESLPPAVKLVESFVMVAGRLELYALLVFFSPSFWKSFD